MELHTTHDQRANPARALAEAALELLAPTRCAGCDGYGNLLCERCAAEVWLYNPALACPHCGAPFGELVCTECWDRTLPVVFTVALGTLDGVLARSVVLHKDQNERRLGPLLGRQLGSVVTLRHPGWVEPDTAVTWVPPSAISLRRRDFDHGRSIAEGVGAALGIVPRPLIAHRGALDNRALGRGGRSDNVAQAFETVGPIEGRVLLVDDVLTTGATASTCANILLAAGAQEVGLAVVARVW